MKNRTTYKVLSLIALGVPLPLNRMYIGEKWLLRLLTANYFYIGSITDVFYMDKRFDEAMARRGYVNTTRRG